MNYRHVKIVHLVPMEILQVLKQKKLVVTIPVPLDHMVKLQALVRKTMDVPAVLKVDLEMLLVQTQKILVVLHVYMVNIKIRLEI